MSNVITMLRGGMSRQEIAAALGVTVDEVYAAELASTDIASGAPRFTWAEQAEELVVAAIPGFAVILPIAVQVQHAVMAVWGFEMLGKGDVYIQSEDHPGNGAFVQSSGTPNGVWMEYHTNALADSGNGMSPTLRTTPGERNFTLRLVFGGNNVGQPAETRFRNIRFGIMPV